MKKLKIIFVLALIAGLSGATLSYVESVTTPIIEENLAEKEKEIHESFFPTLSSYDKVEIDDEESYMDYVSTVYDSNNEVIGYVYGSSGNNAYGSISAMMGVNVEDEFIGLEYSVFNQTPGFGDKVQTEEYLNQFVGMSTSEVEIDGATGATYSSNLVEDLVNEIAEYHEFNNAGGVE